MTHKIHEFDPVIYPFKLWVAVNPDKNDVKAKFYGLTPETSRIEIDDEELEVDFSVATTYPVSEKESGWNGLLVIIHKPKQVGVGVISHEATHVVDWVCDTFGLSGFSFDDGEARAYLAQWVANCIEEVRRSKA